MKRTVYRTAKLGILHTMLTGGVVSGLGDQCEGFNSFWPEYWDSLKDENGKFSEQLIENAIDVLLEVVENNQPFKYYDHLYRFKTPNDHNMAILVKRIKKELEEKEADRNLSDDE